MPSPNGRKPLSHSCRKCQAYWLGDDIFYPSFFQGALGRMHESALLHLCLWTILWRRISWERASDSGPPHKPPSIWPHRLCRAGLNPKIQGGNIHASAATLLRWKTPSTHGWLLLSIICFSGGINYGGGEFYLSFMKRMCFRSWHLSDISSHLPLSASLHSIRNIHTYKLDLIIFLLLAIKEIRSAPG